MTLLDMDVFFKRWNQLSIEEGCSVALGVNVVGVLTVCIVGLGFLYVDMNQKPECIVRYRVQVDKHQSMNMAELTKLRNQLFINYALVGFPYSLAHYILHTLRGSDQSLNLPTLSEFLVHITACIMLFEIAIYYTHRLFHTRYMYKRFHKIHHEWTAPTGLVALYAHPLECAVCNVWVIGSGPLVLGTCQVTTLIWISMASTFVIIIHSGYHLPFLPSPEFHDYHHLKFSGNYGVLGILDRLHGTLNKQFIRSKNFQRDRIIFSADDLKQ